MDLTALPAFLAAVAVGAYVQTVTGFALGLIIIAVASMLDFVSLPMAAAVVNFLSMGNIAFALRRHHRCISWPTVILAGTGLVPAVAGGVYLLERMSVSHSETLRLLLAAFILLAGVVLMLNPKPRRHPSRGAVTVAMGATSGLCGGLFGAAGPPMVYHLYRQPYPIGRVRATLLTVFALSTLLRTAFVGASGGIDGQVIGLAAIALPVVLLGTLAGHRFAPPLSTLNMRRLAFVLLTLLGAALFAL